MHIKKRKLKKNNVGIKGERGISGDVKGRKPCVEAILIVCDILCGQARCAAHSAGNS